jgi:ATP-dependent RNA helicase DeaD
VRVRMRDVPSANIPSAGRFRGGQRYVPLMTSTADEEEQPGTPGFSALGIDPALTGTLAEVGYEEPTPIQREAIPALLAGRDMLGQAATGTGKTAAFALPILQYASALDGAQRKTPSALILVPTRELAMQVAEAVHRYGKSLGVNVVPIYGGQAMQQQLRAIRRGVDVIVATPGRVLDHIRRNSIDFSAVHTVVLDEADEMLDMGFAEDLEAILAALPKERQTALFSATIPPRIAAIARKHLKDPLRLTIERPAAPTGAAPRVREVAYVVARQHKIEALGRVLDMENPASALVFCRTRTEVDQLAEVLGARGYSAEALHGGLNQEQRDRVMRRFRDGTTELLVATDVAARGLDIGHLSHVVNFDVPASPDAYVHRVGRTGRAGREGVAITLLEPKEARLLRSIEHAEKRKISIESVPTALDIRGRKMELTSAAIREILEGVDFAPYRVIVEALANDYDVMDIAAAALHMAGATDGTDANDADLSVVPPPEQAAGRSAKGGKPVKKARRRPGHDGEGEFVKIFVPLGRRSGIRPGDIVGAIANEARIDANSIGTIDITDNFSLVEVRAHDADTVIEALRKTTIRGQKVKARRERF